jgi:hypothetical protein
MQDITEQIKESQDAADAIVPGSQRAWKLESRDSDGNPVERQFVQEELGFFPKQEFLNLLSDEVDKFVKGDYGIKLGELFKGGVREKLAPPDLTGASDEAKAEAVNSVLENNIEMINAFLHLMRVLPELQKDIIALALGTPRGRERDWFKWAIAEPPSRGGLTDDTAFEILKIFVRQNAKAIRSFFEEKATELVEEVQKALELESSTSEEDSTATSKAAVEEPPNPDGTSLGGTPSNTGSPTIPTTA